MAGEQAYVGPRMDALQQMEDDFPPWNRVFIGWGLDCR